MGIVLPIPQAMVSVTAVSIPYLPLGRAIAFPFKEAVHSTSQPDVGVADFGIPGRVVCPHF
jgi:hypothetical protein